MPNASKPSAVLTVSELTNHLKQTLSEDPVLGKALRVQGELSNVKQSSRGHLYFTLKDAGASISGVMWASRLAKLPFEPHEGLEVFANGSLDVYAPSGSYSLVCTALEPVGLGALQLAFNQLKARLEAEGLFDPERKQPLPVFPLRLGLVTAQTGAVLHDMMRIIREKNPVVHVVLAPTKVQGEGAAVSIAAAIKALQAPKLGLDVIIVARGGGSFEDLFCFNEEPVVRAIAECRLPVITGIGHEPDFSLADAAADVTVATPTAAAETAVPNVYTLLQQLEGAGEQLAQTLEQQLLLAEQNLEQAQSQLAQRVDRLLNQQEQTLQQALQGLSHASQQCVQTASHQLSQAAQTLDAFSPLKQLQRGYCLVQDAETAGVIRSVTQLTVGQALSLRLHDGSVTTEVRELN